MLGAAYKVMVLQIERGGEHRLEVTDGPGYWSQTVPIGNLEHIRFSYVIRKSVQRSFSVPSTPLQSDGSDDGRLCLPVSPHSLQPIQEVVHVP